MAFYLTQIGTVSPSYTFSKFDVIVIFLYIVAATWVELSEIKISLAL